MKMGSHLLVFHEFFQRFYHWIHRSSKTEMHLYIIYTSARPLSKTHLPHHPRPSKCSHHRLEEKTHWLDDRLQRSVTSKWIGQNYSKETGRIHATHMATRYLHPFIGRPLKQFVFQTSIHAVFRRSYIRMLPLKQDISLIIKSKHHSDPLRTRTCSTLMTIKPETTTVKCIKYSRLLIFRRTN